LFLGELGPGGNSTSSNFFVSGFGPGRRFRDEKMTEHQTLLAQYATNRSEEAFGELVARFVNLVYSTAVRLVDGDTHRAEDVVQTVFTDLARLSKTLSPGVMLGGWLHRRTYHVATTLMRSERRRQNRERQAAEMHALQEQQESEYEQIAPILDQVVNQLSAPDRQAILLRFFEGRDLQAVGQALSTTEDAARKRVARALDKLRGLLRRQGVVVSGTSLATLLAAQAVTAAPAGLAASVTGAALASAATGSSGLALVLLKLMAMTKIKLAMGAVIVAGLGTTVVLEHQAITRLNEQNRALQARLEGFTLIARDNERLSNLLAQATIKSSLPEDQFSELLKLRGQVGLARRLADENPKLRAENAKLRMASKVANAPPPKEPEDPAEAEFQKETQRREQHLSQWALMFHMYASKANDKSPDTWERVADQLPPAERDSFLSFATNNFEIVYHGELGNSESGGKILFREKQARRSPKGEWVKTYGFASGETETHSEPDGNFAAWESQH
jgi:RNA polymerase sigma factor (sigma-70 family)